MVRATFAIREDFESPTAAGLSQAQLARRVKTSQFCIGLEVIEVALALTSGRRSRIFIVDTMPTSTQIARWGNSLGVRLPKAVAAEAQLAEGDTVEVSVKGGAIVLRPARPIYSLDQLVAKITPRNRHREADWGAPAGHEQW
jgi:antitoxin MazE